MRPIRLELAGFGSFRERAVLDLTGVGLFALTGPTGSGKSTLLDAMVFALYGVVPRYADPRSVAPVISQGQREARVALELMVGDERYLATRVVRRTRTGASTPEARLERLPKGVGKESVVLASSAAEVSAAVGVLLGLSYRHFVRAVVLPQGEFARFLLETAGDRDQLLVELLELAYLDRLREAATRRHRAAHEAAELLASERARHQSTTPEVITTAEQRLAELANALARGEALVATLHAASAALARAEADALAAATELAALGRVVPPADNALTGVGLAAARSDLVQASQRVEQAEGAERVAADELARQPLTAAVTRLGTLRQRTEQVRQAGERTAVELPATAQRWQVALADRQRAAAELVAAELESERARLDHSACELATRLAAGEPCPVCAQPVEQLPLVAVPTSLVAAGQRHAAAVGALSKAQAAERELSRQHERLVDRASAEQTQRRALAVEIVAALVELGRAPDELAVPSGSGELGADPVRSGSVRSGSDESRTVQSGSDESRADELATATAALPGDEEVAALLAARQRAEQTLTIAREQVQAARRERQRVADQLQLLERREQAGWTHFHSVRDGLARLSPPPLGGGAELDGGQKVIAAVVGGESGAPWSLDQAWAELAAWSSHRAIAARLAAESARVARSASEGERRAVQQELATLLSGALPGASGSGSVGAGPGAAGPETLERLRWAVDQQRQHLAQLAASRAEAERLDLLVTERRRAAALARALGQHLRSDGFRAWLLRHAVERLAAGATVILEQLSRGQLGLALGVGNDFVVVDHQSADEQRPVRTLSGGETFLASLALALALADDLAAGLTTAGPAATTFDLAAGGVPLARLDTLLLDEGFGALDDETLDIVATTLEALGARGRMVGVVTHLPELAERLPVRFAVRRDESGSRVERQ